MIVTFAKVTVIELKEVSTQVAACNHTLWYHFHGKNGIAEFEVIKLINVDRCTFPKMLNLRIKETSGPRLMEQANLQTCLLVSRETAAS